MGAENSAAFPALNALKRCEKKVSHDSASTLTSQLGSNTGGKFGNGMVWLAIDVAKASSTGYTFGIAQSNPANTYIGYDYNVKIAGEKLIVSFDDRFLRASVTAKVYSAAPGSHDNSGHVALGPGDTVYLYVHIENGISWYTTGNYEFVEWRYKDTYTGDYALVKTETGDYTFVRTETGEYALVDTKIGDYKLVDTVYSDYTKDTMYGDYTKDTVYGDYSLVDTKEISRETVTDPYNVDFDLVAKNAANVQVYKGTLNSNNGQVTMPQLLPGTYTVTLSGADIGNITSIDVRGEELYQSLSPFL